MHYLALVERNLQLYSPPPGSFDVKCYRSALIIQQKRDLMGFSHLSHPYAYEDSSRSIVSLCRKPSKIQQFLYNFFFIYIYRLEWCIFFDRNSKRRDKCRP